MGKISIKDEWGDAVRAGDSINFSYGIPPVRVDGAVIEDKGELWVLTPGHTPDRAKLKELPKYGCPFFKNKKPRRQVDFRIASGEAPKGATE